jgi:hypothetical protein
MVGVSLRSLIEASPAIGPLFKRIKPQRYLVFLALIFFLLATIWLFGPSIPRSRPPNPIDESLPLPSYPSSSPGRPATIPHPIRKLIASAREEFTATASRQSRTLKEAVKEYRRRYKIPPPPHFDKWYDFAVANKVQLIDEYDAIHQLLLPFWGLSPRAIRKRLGDALGADDFLIGVFIRGGKVAKMERGPEWRQDALSGMMKKFVQYLPDMDLAVNLHDEPRVIVPHDDLARLLQTAQKDTMRKATANKSPRNGWSARPKDVNDGHIVPFNITPFNDNTHQFTWAISKLSCPLDTPARTLDFHGERVPDRLAAYAVDELGFIYNRTAFTDICLSPSLEESVGSFNKPNSFNVAHDLIPIFAPSKISSFQDILYPSPWYWADKVFLNETRDPPWDSKIEKLYWRGTTTSGYSANGAWHRQQRQRFIQKISKPGSLNTLEYSNRNNTPSPGWHVKKVQQQDYTDLFDVHFTFVGQCSEMDCETQRQYFDLRNDTDFQEVWENKYLLDIDGNAFSGRFYTFLQSKSLTFKQALFREWHDESLMPWAHYVPLSIKGDEHLEALRWFHADEEGRAQARVIAEDSSQWARRALRHVDMEAWFFRLLLEYGRVVDDGREGIGFLPS